MSGASPRILLGVTGSVATIRTDRLLSALAEVGSVQVVATERAMAFLPELPEDVRVWRDHDEWESWKKLGDPILHIELRRWADVFVIAPLSADSLAKMSLGLCDNLLLSVARAWDYEKPLVVAPAMNTLMWEHPVTAEHLARLEKWGVQVVPPISKELACADIGMGAQALAETIAHRIREVLA